MSKILKKGLALFLALICAMNLAVVSFAQEEEVSYFDEETGTLYLMTENWFEDLGIEETDEALFAFCGKVKTVYFDEKCGIAEYFAYCLYFYNLEKILVDEDSTEFFVYDNALYCNYIDGDEERCALVCYPVKCPDKDIVLYPEATQFMIEGFNIYNPELDGVVLNENEYNLYIVEEGQFEKIKGDLAGIGNMMYIKFANIYVNDTQESIDETHIFKSLDLETFSKMVAFEYFTVYYQYYNEERYDEFTDKMDEIQSEIVAPEDTDDPVAMKEYYTALYSGWLDYANTLDHVEYTEELHAQMGREPEGYAYYKALTNCYYDLYVFCRDRGNPIKPLSTLTSGTCGEGVEWAIDRESGVLSITGNGAIADNYSGFDVFKNIVTTVAIGNGITAIGENVFTGFTALTETKFDGTQAQWNTVAVADGNDDLLKNVTVNPDPPVEPAEPTFGEKVAEFFEKVKDFFVGIYEWFANLFKF